MNNLRLSIHQTFGQIGIRTQPASQDIHSPSGELSIRQPQAKMDIQSPQGELQIDSSAAWEALGVGPNLAWTSAIYTQSKDIVLRGIAKIVADGNRMAQISNPRNAFAELAGDAYPATNPVDYVNGDPSYFNVKIEYTPKHPELDIEPQKPQIQYTSNKPQIDYHPGSLDIYLRQNNSIDIQVSRYDVYK